MEEILNLLQIIVLSKDTILDFFFFLKFFYMHFKTTLLNSIHHTFTHFKSIIKFSFSIFKLDRATISLLQFQNISITAMELLLPIYSQPPSLPSPWKPLICFASLWISLLFHFWNMKVVQNTHNKIIKTGFLFIMFLLQNILLLINVMKSNQTFGDEPVNTYFTKSHTVGI